MEQQEYWTEISSLAAELVRAVRADETDDPYQWLHETIDGHQWVIYTGYNLDVLRHSGNDSAAWDEGLAQSCDSWGSVLACAAFCAMQRDILDELAEEHGIHGLDVGDFATVTD